jgi:hypothetical protein
MRLGVVVVLAVSASIELEVPSVNDLITSHVFFI